MGIKPEELEMILKRNRFITRDEVKLMPKSVAKACDPYLKAIESHKKTLLRMGAMMKPIKAKSSKSILEEKFLNLWKTLRGPSLRQEYTFSDRRKFRFDYVHLKTATAIEVNGGVYVKGGHSTGKGIERDYQKNNEAIICGYQTFQLSTGMVTAKNLLEIINFIEKREKFLGEHV